jgi:hypothetical protein
VGGSAAGSAVGGAETMREEPKVMRPSIAEIFTALERTRRCAQAWAHSQPEHGEELNKCIKDLDQISLELKNSVVGKARLQSSRGRSMVEGNIFGIVNCLTPVITFAEIISERHQKYTVPLKRFQEEVRRVQQELFKKVSPGARSDED